MLKFLFASLLIMIFSSDVYAQTFYGWRYREHATDCTSLTDGKPRDLCFEVDSNTLYKCEPTAGDCSGSEWKLVGGGGYTNLTQFVAQTNWRMFYSDGSGDVNELAFGDSGKVLQSNGASSAPTWETPSGGSGLTQSQVLARGLGA
jgi:hypothetical protein